MDKGLSVALPSTSPICSAIKIEWHGSVQTFLAEALQSHLEGMLPSHTQGVVLLQSLSPGELISEPNSWHPAFSRSVSVSRGPSSVACGSRKSCHGCWGEQGLFLVFLLWQWQFFPLPPPTPNSSRPSSGLFNSRPPSGLFNSLLQLGKLSESQLFCLLPTWAEHCGMLGAQKIPVALHATKQM